MTVDDPSKTLAGLRGPSLKDRGENVLRSFANATQASGDDT
jgi:hypothetical protein